MDYKEFSGYYNKLVMEMKTFCPNVVVMSGADTFCEDALNETYLAQRQEIEARNAIAQKTASDLEVEFFDLFNLMKEKGSMYGYKDWIHFELRANAFIAYEMLTFMKNSFEDLAIEADAAKENFCSKLAAAGQNILVYDNSDTVYWLLKYLNITEKVSCFLKLISDEREIYGIPIKELEKTTAEERKEFSVLYENKSDEELLQKFGYEQLHLLSKIYK